MIINPYVFGVAYDPDAQAFFTASGLTGATNLNAINQLVVDMKGYGIWTKMKAIYPFVGGTAALHKWNLKDPQDTNAAFRLTFNGGWTHSANGVQGNGTNAYCDTFYIPSINTTLNNSSYGVYSRTNSANAGTSFGTLNGIYEGLSLVMKFTDSTCYYSINDNLGNGFFSNSNSTAGFYQITTNGIAKNIHRNLSQIYTFGQAGSFLPTNSLLFNARFVTGIGINSYDSRQYSFFYISSLLTASEINNFYTAVQAYQTTLSRNV